MLSADRGAGHQLGLRERRFVAGSLKTFRGNGFGFQQDSERVLRHGRLRRRLGREVCRFERDRRNDGGNLTMLHDRLSGERAGKHRLHLERGLGGGIVLRANRQDLPDCCSAERIICTAAARI